MKNTLKIVAYALIAVWTPPALALDKIPYTPESFKAAQDAGKPILVDIWASWCPTCKKQGPILEKLTNLPQYKGLTVFEVNFDNQKEAVKSFGARVQSTLIAYRGTNETGRSAGQTSEDAIESVIMSAF